MSKSYTKTVFVPKTEIDRLNRLLDVVYDEEDMEREGIDFDSTLFLRTVKFDDGHEADVKVCSGQHNLWSEAVLFDPDGNEVSCVDDCSYEHIDGEWRLEDGDAEYNVIVKEKEGQMPTRSEFTEALRFQGVEPYEWVERDGILYARCRPGGCLWDTGVALRLYDEWRKKHQSKKALESHLRWLKVRSVKDAWDIDEKTILKERLYDDDRLQRWVRRNTDWLD